MDAPFVAAVSRAAQHVISKQAVASIRLRAGYGVEGDAHYGTTVQHRYNRKRDPTRANLRQVHLIGAELYDELVAAGFDVEPGGLGENITTRGIDLQRLPLGTRLRLGVDAVLELTGLRDPCGLIDRVRPGLRAAVTETFNGAAVVRHGAMAIVVTGGDVRVNDRLVVELPDPRWPRARAGLR